MYLGWLIIAIKFINFAPLFIMYINVQPSFNIPISIITGNAPWIIIGLSLVQAGRWIILGDNIRIAFGKALQLLGCFIAVLMLPVLISSLIDWNNGGSTALESFLDSLFSVITILTAVSLIISGRFLKRGAGKIVLIPLLFITAALFFVVVRFIS